MSSVKSTAKHGVLLAVETTSYASGTPSPSASTDGFLASAYPTVTPGYQNDGKRTGKVTGGLSALKNVNPSGRKLAIDLMHEFRGPSSANPYSASLFPDVHRVLRAVGMSAAYSATPTPQWTYQPVSDSWTSLVGSIYTRGQVESFKGGYVSALEISANGKVVPDWKITLSGISTGLPTDQALPAITYRDAAIMPPKATNIQLGMTSGGQTYLCHVSDFTYKFTRALTERENQNDSAGGHGGFALGAATATLDVTIEASALETSSPFISSTTFDPYRILDAGNAISLSLNVGSVQYNRFKISTANAQFSADPKDAANGPVAQWQLSFVFSPADDATDIDNTILIN